MPDPFRIDVLARADAQLKAAILKQPPSAQEDALAAFKAIVCRSRTASFEFGEELYNLKHLGLQVRLGIQLPIAIHFGADEKNRIVIIQTATILL